MTAFTISVYQKKRDRNLEWTTLGLGPLTRFSVGNNPTRISRTLADELRGAIKELRPTDVPALELVPGRRLVRVHLELTFKASSGPARVSGLYPFITEPRWIGPGERALVVYHPKRQEDWFVLREDLTIADHARRFLRKRWERIDAELARETLLTDGRDVLRAFSFSERAPQLIDRLPSEEDVFADLIAEERRRERADVKKTRARKPRYGRAELRKVGVNVTFRVADGLEPLGRPRSPWREQLARLATGPRKSSVVLVGPEGVGKTTLLLQLVRDLLESDDYLSHRNLDRVHEVWRTSARRILAGMSYVGDWEKRCVQLVSEATDPRVVLLVEDLHSFARAGRTRDSDRCLADVFRGPVARGDVTILAEATPSEWQRLEEQAPAFADRFATIRVAPTSPRETIALMLHAARELEPVLKVRFDPDAYRVLHQLAPVLNPSAAAPGVAVDMLRALAADHAARLPTSAEATDDESDVAEIGIDETYELLSRRSGLPTALLRLDAELDPEDLERRFAQHVMGQPDAVRAAVDLVARIRAGLTAPGRPFASYLFTGPTGTGKTQMAKAIAGFLYGDESRLVRIDMGEMSGPDAVG
ncbi:MAG: AAA family ATPase, partial [Sandaracinaceae bacterium]